MISNSDDSVLRQDMPAALAKVEEAARLLVEASAISQGDPTSKVARSKLIEGSRCVGNARFSCYSLNLAPPCYRWILQGTSNVLLVFDESEVRKIIAECKKVLDYLSVAEVIETMEDLVQFVRDLSPCLSKVRRGGE